jgi:hypothetical protein
MPKEHVYNLVTDILTVQELVPSVGRKLQVHMKNRFQCS